MLPTLIHLFFSFFSSCTPVQAGHRTADHWLAQHALDERQVRGGRRPTGWGPFQLDLQQHPERVAGAELTRQLARVGQLHDLPAAVGRGTGDACLLGHEQRRTADGALPGAYSTGK